MVFLKLILFLGLLYQASALREFRSWSNRTNCVTAQWPNYPFAYQKYPNQTIESKSRTNTNLQDFRHECQVKGGRSKCHICEDIECRGEGGICHLQLQGVDAKEMSGNIPVVSDSAWAVGGSHMRDFGGDGVTHFCVMLTGGKCILPQTTDFSKCKARCFGYGFPKPSVWREVPERSVTDVYIPPLWDDHQQVDMWVYPRNCSELSSLQDMKCTYDSPSGGKDRSPSFNPQGFSFTLAGSGQKGFLDGPGVNATFNNPLDIAVDSRGVIYVADTGNNAIRMVDVQGNVQTVAGLGANHEGFLDGPCDVATFTQPSGLDVYYNSVLDTTTIVIADTGNHRLRKIVVDHRNNLCDVRCFSGLCGNNSNSESLFRLKASPNSGYADGDYLYSRFSSPRGIAFLEDWKTVVVADTGNYLIRWVYENGTAWTLAGTIVPGLRDPNGNPLAGCPPPCMVGEQGLRDGNLTFAQFYNPVDVTRGPNRTVWVADEHRIRIIDIPDQISVRYGVESKGRVSTIAGNSLQGREDGTGDEATFFEPNGLFLTADNIAYVTDTASCRIRRISPLPLVAQSISCEDTAIDVFRPSGCTSFDQPIDKIGRKVSRVEANVQYNYGFPYKDDLDRGKYTKNCVGIPPPDRLDKHFVGIQGDNLVIDDNMTIVNEFGEQGTAIMIRCPSTCLSSNAPVFGTVWYSEYSSICRAAIHDGKLTPGVDGYIQITYQRRAYLWGKNSSFTNSSVGFGGIISRNYTRDRDVSRVFSIEPFHRPMSVVHTVGGIPSAPLEDGCGFDDGQPPTLARFDRPNGVAARYGSTLSDKTYIYIADSGNNRIRGMSAVCTIICENGGRCIGEDQCSCATGWTGIDCTIPICTSKCGKNSICVAPDKCGCKPGYSGANCAVPQCRQKCLNGGVCAAPDTCKCASGWFDTNCTTPVCSQTCANGGNCTAPYKCACPAEWKGPDCRTPVCIQECKNGGRCMAPNTCACPPQYTNYDCSVPVCHQGYFRANPIESQRPHVYAAHLRAFPTYKQCDMQSWCNMTNEFECRQSEMKYGIIQVPSGPEYRNFTGRKTPPSMCMNIELPIHYKIPFELLNADGSTTGYRRYSPNRPYQSNPDNPWRGYLEPTVGHTGPWTYTADRQLAFVNWLNVSQGVYVCANGGNCSAPDICECPRGWIGFDCRTPVCNQGYYEPKQTDYVSSQKVLNETVFFERFLGNNSYRLSENYSNPQFQTQWEFYVNDSYVERVSYDFGGVDYFGPVEYTDASGNRVCSAQGGYRCSIRANTEWENKHYILSHPNFYSRYMDTKTQADGNKYTHWVNMYWPPVHQKSRILDQQLFNTTFVYTNEGYRRWGIWNRTGNHWLPGICLMEFHRNCSALSKTKDLQSGLYNVLVQDTDLSFRPRLYYDDLKVYGEGRWTEEGGSCVDHVIRGCYNNGTCIAPDVCQCARGWSGSNCSIPVCSQSCNHHGNCTLPDTCTCEKGWTGDECTIPICAQECQNDGRCVAPDVCQCSQWPNDFVDGRIAGGRPLFQDQNGNPLSSGWTGYDCSVPICVQAEKFYLNVMVDNWAKPELNMPVDWLGPNQAVTGTNPNNIKNGFVSLGGHGAAALMACVDSNGKELPRCPDYDLYVTGNDGSSFQTGCGFDPFDTGCCMPLPDDRIICYYCPEDQKVITNHTFFCRGGMQSLEDYRSAYLQKFPAFLDRFFNFRMCGQYHGPRTHTINTANSNGQQDYGTAQYYRNPSPFYSHVIYSSQNYRSNYTGNRFLCRILQWVQGDYIDNAGLGNIDAVGSIYGLTHGRHVRVNTPNLKLNADKTSWSLGPKVQGEGVYACYHDGTCIGPDVCTCTDGYEGYDCNTPLCRHLQITGAVSSCLNGGICVLKDQCVCITIPSVLYVAHPSSSRGLTGWTGTDCSIPICVQGYFDPFCTDLGQAPAGEGCFRCANGGNCTAPDVCTCAPGWTGFDCKTPVCETVADPLTRTQLGVVYEDKVIAFESDPCGLVDIYGMHGWKGTKYSRGNCTQPNLCTCLCKVPYNMKACKKTGELCSGPWQDPLVKHRDVLAMRGVEYIFGSSSCSFGYEGNVNEMDQFVTCHQTSYVPTNTERTSIGLIVGLSIFGFVFFAGYYYINDRIKQRYLLAKIERRRSKRSSEESLTQAKAGAFVNK